MTTKSTPRARLETFGLFRHGTRAPIASSTDRTWLEHTASACKVNHPERRYEIRPLRRLGAKAAR